MRKPNENQATRAVAQPPRQKKRERVADVHTPTGRQLVISLPRAEIYQATVILAKFNMDLAQSVFKRITDVYYLATERDADKATASSLIGTVHIERVQNRSTHGCWHFQKAFDTLRSLKKMVLKLDSFINRNRENKEQTEVCKFFSNYFQALCHEFSVQLSLLSESKKDELRSKGYYKENELVVMTKSTPLRDSINLIHGEAGTETVTPRLIGGEKRSDREKRLRDVKQKVYELKDFFAENDPKIDDYLNQLLASVTNPDIKRFVSNMVKLEPQLNALENHADPLMFTTQVADNRAQKRGRELSQFFNTASNPSTNQQVLTQAADEESIASWFDLSQ